MSRGADRDLIDAVERALDRIHDDGLARCGTDRAAGVRDLRTGLGYAAGTDRPQEPFLTALAACGVEIVVLPVSAVLAPGEEKQFSVIVTSEEARLEGLGGGIWSATGGTVSPAGLYRAPESAGTFEVRATSTLNPERTATARVTVIEPPTCDDAPARASLRTVQPGDVTLRTPADVQGFRDAGITEVTGNVTIGGEAGEPSTLIDLSGLEALETVGGTLSIADNPELRSLNGLTGLETTGALTVSANPLLTSLDGLCRLTDSGDAVSLVDNVGLESIAALSGVTVRSILVLRNPALTTLDGLEGTTSLGFLSIQDNAGLESIAGVSDLTSADTLAVLGSPDLTTLAPLGGVTTVEQLRSPTWG